MAIVTCVHVLAPGQAACTDKDFDGLFRSGGSLAKQNWFHLLLEPVFKGNSVTARSNFCMQIAHT